MIARNWRGRRGELDIVVLRSGALRFVEVKARGTRGSRGLDAVGGRKRARLVSAAEQFLQTVDFEFEEAAFAVALIEDGHITWIDDAFDGL